ncbi:3-hydroxyacyl-ACP dehydratase FabZ family protein [Streptomyces sp. NPDC005930]|uniref:3-hydroxyacyl-ACP dehydratase FabZ family protein n=1 Tax=Streptomyces sp. NPDC005930 TaxID=3364736 RepID=UPI003685A5FB
MTAPAGTASPVAATVRVGSRTPEGLTATAEVDILDSEPVFAGHYPGFPIFPGVCVLECVRRAAADAAPGVAPGPLTAVESARFATSVHPGDTLTLALTWHRVESGWRCDATAGTARGRAARVKLRFAAPGGPR